MKGKKWVRFHHKLVAKISNGVMTPFIKYKYHVKCEKFKERRRQYLILCNHQTPFDQFFIVKIFKKPVYFVATEDIFSGGFLSNLLRTFCAPIPIKKGDADISAVMNCMRVARQGGSIAIFPEGNRTYSGKTGYIKPSIAKMVKALKLPVAIVKFEGGYGIEPRWSNKVRKGKGRAYVKRVIECEEYSKLSNEEIYEIIKSELYTDESQDTGVYKSKKRAEYLERVFYYCPKCGFSKFTSNGNTVTCDSCKSEIEYAENKKLIGKNFKFPYDTVAKWYEAQNDFVNKYDYKEYLDKPLFTDTASFRKVIVYKKKEVILKKADLSLFGDRIEIVGSGIKNVYAFSDIVSVAVMGRNKCNFNHGGNLYQLKGDKGFNALKYLNLYYRYCNENGGNNDTFLGI